MCCRNCFSRTIVWFLNLALLIAGIGGAVFGSLLLASKYGPLFRDLSICIISFGTFLMLLAVVALCGASCKRTKKCYMVVYVFVLFALILGQIGVVVVFIVSQSDLKEFLRERWTNNLNDKQRAEIMRTAQCGFEDKKVFLLTMDYLEDLEGESGFEDVNGNSLNGEDLVDLMNVGTFNDCYKKLKKEFSKLGVVAILVGLGVIGLQTISLVASCTLVCEEDHENKTVQGWEPESSDGSCCCCLFQYCCCGILEGCCEEAATECCWFAVDNILVAQEV